MKNKQMALALILIVGIGVTACAQQYDSESDFKASPLDGGKSAEITGYVGSKWEVRIPPRIQGVPVTSIGSGAFYRSTNIISITIPNSVTNIGKGAFGSCSQLAEIKVAAGNNAYTADNGVLYSKDKTSLHTYPKGKTEVSFTIPNGVISIGDYAFGGCTSLTSVTIPNGITSIGEDAFSGCTSLTSVTIPNGVISIGEYAFYETGFINGFFEILRPLAAIMNDYESVPPEQRRDRYDDILLNAITSQPNIVRIFSIWKPYALDGMDRKYIGRSGSTATGQYAMTYGRDNGKIAVTPNLDIEYTMSYLNDPFAREDRFDNPTPFKLNGQDTYIVRIEVAIINPRTYEAVGSVGCILDIR